MEKIKDDGGMREDDGTGDDKDSEESQGSEDEVAGMVTVCIGRGRLDDDISAGCGDPVLSTAVSPPTDTLLDGGSSGMSKWEIFSNLSGATDESSAAWVEALAAAAAAFLASRSSRFFNAASPASAPLLFPLGVPPTFWLDASTCWARTSANLDSSH